MLGFLSVSTGDLRLDVGGVFQFQSRAGFSECLDVFVDGYIKPETFRFNPVLGFLSVSTDLISIDGVGDAMFQSRAGFSECLDRTLTYTTALVWRFQSRAGFSECLDTMPVEPPTPPSRFNPVLGFLSVSTSISSRAR